jgi:hypothetical protein
MLSTHDTSDVPEARTMIIFLGHLFARLKESSDQIRAAIKIQKMLRLKKFRTARHRSAVLIQRRFATYAQQRKYGMIIREWRAYKSCCDPSVSQHQENSFESDGFDWEEEMAKELELQVRNAPAPARSGESIPISTSFDDEEDVLFLVEKSDGRLGASELLRVVDIENIDDEDSAVDDERGEGVGVGVDGEGKDEIFDYGNNFSVDNPDGDTADEDNYYSDRGDSGLKEVSVKLQYGLSVDLDETESTEITSQCLLGRLPMMSARKMSLGFRRLQVSHPCECHLKDITSILAQRMQMT